MLLMKDYIGRKGRKGDLGLELEVEADAPLPTIKDAYWITKTDPSLRGLYNAEYISAGPQEIGAANKGIRSLCWELNQKKYQVKSESHRTSFHVHSNILYDTPTQYWNKAIAYWLLEDLLFEYCKSHRKGNTFCLRLSDAEYVLKESLDVIKKGYVFPPERKIEALKYGSQNIVATSMHGTLERRGMDGTIDATRLETWTSTIYTLDSKAKNYKSPEDLLNSYLRTDARPFVESLVGSSFAGLVCQGKDWQDRLRESAGALAELAYFHDWEAWQSRLEKNFQVPKAKDTPDFDPVPAPANLDINAVRQRMNDLTNGWTR